MFRPLLRGKELYTQMGFFVQSILADRYIHRRELRLVSLESFSSVEYGISKIFLIFVFYRELSRFKFWENRVNSGEILFTFSGIFTKLPNFAKICYTFRKCCWFLFVKTKKYCKFFLLIFLSKKLANYFKIKTFSSKTARNKFLFSPVWLNLQEVQTQTPLTQSLYTQKGACSTSNSVESALYLKLKRFLLNLFVDYQKRRHFFWYFK